MAAASLIPRPRANLGVDFTNRPEIVTAINGGRAEGSRHSDTLAGNLLYVAVPVTSGGVVHGAVRITYPSSTLDAARSPRVDRSRPAVRDSSAPSSSRSASPLLDW